MPNQPTQPTFSYMKQSDILKCPFAIMMPEHYNSDGSCKCSDPDHRAMMIAGSTLKLTS